MFSRGDCFALMHAISGLTVTVQWAYCCNLGTMSSHRPQGENSNRDTRTSPTITRTSTTPSITSLTNPPLPPHIRRYHSQVLLHPLPLIKTLVTCTPKTLIKRTAPRVLFTKYHSRQGFAFELDLCRGHSAVCNTTGGPNSTTTPSPTTSTLPIATETRTLLLAYCIAAPASAPPPSPPLHPSITASPAITRPQHPRRGDRHGDYPNNHEILGRICQEPSNIVRLKNCYRLIFCCWRFMGFRMPEMLFGAL